MSGEIKLFKRELFGGFDRRDVVEYIRKLADERNNCMDAQKAAEEEVERLKSTINELRTELDEANRLIREVRVDALADAQNAICELDNAYIDIRTDIEATSNHIRGELLKAADTVSLMTRVFERAGQRLGELSGILAKEKETTGGVSEPAGPAE